VEVPQAFWFVIDEVYDNGDREFINLCFHQYDPGRLLFAWANWNRADIPPGEAMMLDAGEKHVVALVRWLEGLPGITFKLLRNDKLDWSLIEVPDALKRFYMKARGNPLGLTPGAVHCAVRDPRFY